MCVCVCVRERERERAEFSDVKSHHLLFLCGEGVRETYLIHAPKYIYVHHV